MFFEWLALIYQFMALVTGSIFFLSAIGGEDNRNPTGLIVTVFVTLFFALIWPIAIFTIFDKDFRLSTLVATKRQLIAISIIALGFLYFFQNSELVEKNFYPEKYLSRQINEYTEAIKYHRAMISKLSAINFHVPDQEEDLRMHRYYLQECSNNLVAARKELMKTQKSN